ncbi:tripartite tricarboxylate transporter substrate binding protein [Achromobacter sp. MFA1 R4]|uniref:Bug family tripartite tricarboxylate transporter substrate binding protein n=1 Tax=Achromobacter sp. MFA1 R4 TaxID=1881016 RepID=UPI0009536E5B|nr:tripartite tricarboxylate transporter substrate binding protein [Achromobacter sp. MFA1 R4]SIT22372.1 Tripartite-type tricarboxylate transporter, receptor component TctC [Achromobacter sp. MFA1 R4]
MKSILHPLRAALVSLCAASALAAAPASAADYPARSISLVVGYPAGGSLDLTARLLGEELGKRLGQTVVVENVGGAGGTIGAQRVARAAPDGYTIFLGSTNEMVIARMINTAVKYDSAKDFTALGIVASQPMLLAASKNSGVKTAAEYLEKLKGAAPGTFNYGSSGVGTTLHLAGEMINEATGTRAEHVPYRGVSPLVTDLMSGQLDFGMLVLSSGLPQVRSGNIVALGLTENKRSPAAPEIAPLAATKGFESVDINLWFALYGPAGLPEPVVAKLRAALDESLKSEQFRSKLQDAGGEVAKPGIDPVTFQAEETKKYGALVKAAKIEAQ